LPASGKVQHQLAAKAMQLGLDSAPVHPVDPNQSLGHKLKASLRLTCPFDGLGT
jgi:hypothetical protein